MERGESYNIECLQSPVKHNGGRIMVVVSWRSLSVIHNTLQ